MSKEKTFNLIKKYKWFLLGSIIIVGLFYWYSYRPYKLDKKCISYAINRTKEISNGDQADVRYFFWKCQKEHGLSE